MCDGEFAPRRRDRPFLCPADQKCEDRKACETLCSDSIFVPFGGSALLHQHAELDEPAESVPEYLGCNAEFLLEVGESAYPQEVGDHPEGITPVGEPSHVSEERLLEYQQFHWSPGRSIAESMALGVGASPGARLTATSSLPLVLSVPSVVNGSSPLKADSLYSSVEPSVPGHSHWRAVHRPREGTNRE